MRAATDRSAAATTEASKLAQLQTNHSRDREARRLVESINDPVGELAVSAVEGVDAGHIVRKGVVNERFLQFISVAT